MKSAKKNWLSQLFKSFRSSSKKSGYKPQPLRMEILEERAMLNVAPVLTLDSATYDITSNSPWYIPLTSTDSDGDAVYYKVEVLSGDLTCDLSVGTAWQTGMTSEQMDAYFNTRNPYWELTIYQEGNEILTGEGSTMLFELFADKAPNTVENILTLTDNEVSLPNGKTEKFYQNSIFHRVINGFMSQAGAYDAYGYYRGSIVSNIADEFNSDLQMNSVGVLAMANSSHKDTGSSQFFVTSERCDWLNFKHSVFGFLIDGQEVQAEVNRQGTGTNSEPNPKVVITNAQQVVNKTNSTLTVRSGDISSTSSTATIRVTPYDQHGLAGASETITVNIVSEQQVPVFYPIENDYAFVEQGNNYTHTFEAGYATGERLGYVAELYYIKYDETGRGKFTYIPNGAAANYETGEVTVNCADYPMGDYYLAVLPVRYNSSHTVSDSDYFYTKDSSGNNVIVALNVPIVIGPESVPAPTSVSLAPSDDTGVIGDGYTSVNTGTTFIVEGANSQYNTEIYAGQYYRGSGIAEEGATSVSIASEQYDSTTQSYTPAEFGYGAYDIVAVNAWYCRYWGDSGWAWASVYSEPTPVFEFYTVLDTPENLTVSDITSTRFNFDWSDVDGADSYYLEIRLKGTEEWSGGLLSESSYSFSGLDPNTVFEVRVSAYLYGYQASLSLPSEIIEVQTLAPDPSEILPTPENLTASGVTFSGFNLSWDAVDDADCYVLEYREKGTEEWYRDVWNNEESPTMCSLPSLDSDCVYEIRIYAYDSTNPASLSAPSDIIEVRTLGFLNAPANVWAEISDRTISVSWDAVNNASAYNVYYRELGTEQWSVGEENLSALAFQFDLSEGENANFYEVAVQAISDSGYGPSYAAVALVTAGETSLLSATLTTWNDRNSSTAPVSVNEWEFLNLQLVANPDDVVDNGGISIVFQYDATLFKPDWANSEFYGISYSYHSVPLDEYGTVREVTITAAVTDPMSINNGLVANVKMVPANPSDFKTQEGVSLAGVALEDETRDLTITVFTDKDKTASEANVITTPVWAVPYDLNDTGMVDVRDFMLFAAYFGAIPDPDVKDMPYYCNYDAIGSVDVRDFMLFASHFGMSFAQNGSNIVIKNQDKADALNAQGAAPVAEPIAPANAEELNQTVVTAVLLEPIQDCVLIPVSSSNTSSSDYYFADVIQHSNAVNTLSNQTEQSTYADSAENYAFVQEESDVSSSLNETAALNPENVDLFFELELFNDDENSDLEDELSEELLPSLPNRNFFAN